LTLPNPIEHPLGPLTLVGYAAPEQLQPGQEMWLWLYWQARQSIEEDAVIHVGLSSGQENTAADFSLAEAAGDLTSWQPGQVRRTVYHLPTSPRLIGEKAEITIGVSAGAALEEIVLAREIELDVRSRTFTKPQMEQTLDIAFGAPPELTLLGASINVDENKSNETLPVTLFWRAESEMKANYTVFIQLLNQNDQIVAQNDQYPLNGVAPTSTWLPSEILTDPHQLALPALAAGQYRLIVGMYDAATGRRLPVNNGQDYVELVPLTIQ
jgi:hypothetical protein